MISRSLGPEAGSAIGKFSNLNLNLQSNMTLIVFFPKTIRYHYIFFNVRSEFA